jgi:hypothetical protein
MLRSSEVFSKVAVDLARVGSRIYGFRRYLHALRLIKMKISLYKT